jgi:hypothetical protein
MIKILLYILYAFIALGFISLAADYYRYRKPKRIDVGRVPFEKVGKNGN